MLILDVKGSFPKDSWLFDVRLPEVKKGLESVIIKDNTFGLDKKNVVVGFSYSLLDEDDEKDKGLSTASGKKVIIVKGYLLLEDQADIHSRAQALADDIKAYLSGIFTEYKYEVICIIIPSDNSWGLSGVI